MLRAFLVLLTILVAVLAFVFDRPWLYAAALVPFVGVVGAAGWRLWTRYRSHRQQERPSAARPGEDKDLEELGIMDVRPQERDKAASADTRNASTSEDDADPDGAMEAETVGRTPTPVSPAPPAPDRAAVARTSTEAAPDESVAAAPARGAGTAPSSSLPPLLESIRAALGARTVCVLVQEEVVLEYRIEACASDQSAARQDGSFETQTPLLTATMSRQPVTVRMLDEEIRAQLGYYTDPPDILTQMAVAPVPQPDEATMVFLVADAGDETELDTSRTRSLLEHFAETVQLLRQTEGDAEAPADATQTLSGNGHAPTPDPPAASKADAEEQPRPRRDIIAEEMEAAEAAAEDLALVLVHLNRAEAIARQGEAAVDSAERRFRTRLEQAAPGQRVERFGELTYGIFVRQGPPDVEDWAIHLKETMDQEEGALEGGVSVGAAVRGESHADPEHLRADATEALRESYETGTCTIVA